MFISSLLLSQSGWRTHDNAEAANQSGQCRTAALCGRGRRQEVISHCAATKQTSIDPAGVGGDERGCSQLLRDEPPLVSG